MRVFDFKTQRWSSLAKGDTDTNTEFSTWSRDGQFIYFLRPWDDLDVYRIRPSGGDPERVVDLIGFLFTEVYAYWMGLDPEDTPMLLRNAVSDEIYALKLETK